MGAKKVAKVWTAAERKRKSEGMKAYWKKKRAAEEGSAVAGFWKKRRTAGESSSLRLPPMRKQAVDRMVPQAKNVADIQIWQAQPEPGTLSSRLIKVELAAAALREALAAL